MKKLALLVGLAMAHGACSGNSPEATQSMDAGADAASHHAPDAASDGDASFDAASGDGADGADGDAADAGENPAEDGGGSDASGSDAGSDAGANGPDDAGAEDGGGHFDAGGEPADDAGAGDAGLDAAPESCGNLVVDPDELCDIAIASGPGACPTVCADGLLCTSDLLENGGTCRAACTFPEITSPSDGDGCCPEGASALDDDDCDGCGNGSLDDGEACDDGNEVDDDACTNSCSFPTAAFRFDDLDLRDPHGFVSFIACLDVTDQSPFGFSLNGELQTSIQDDADGDGLLDMSPTLVFPSFSQSLETQPVELHFASCTAPMESTECEGDEGSAITATATHMEAGQCLSALPGTVAPYGPSIITPNAPCFVTSPVTVSFDLGGIPLTLTDARIAATYSGDPALGLSNGLLMGFLSEADADATIIPQDFPLVGGQPLSRLLRGGTGNCSSGSDKDVHEDVSGWWVYMNYSASQVFWTAN